MELRGNGPPQDGSRFPENASEQVGDVTQLLQALRRVRERLARLYEAWGKPEPAAAWRDSLTAPGTLPAGG